VASLPCGPVATWFVLAGLGKGRHRSKAPRPLWGPLVARRRLPLAVRRCGGTDLLALNPPICSKPWTLQPAVCWRQLDRESPRLPSCLWWTYDRPLGRAVNDLSTGLRSAVWTGSLAIRVFDPPGAVSPNKVVQARQSDRGRTHPVQGLAAGGLGFRRIRSVSWQVF